jgi:AraC-like DNA-binding protein
MIQSKEWTRVWHNAHLDLALFQASYVRHSYPRHSHDYYVICVIERGWQSFTHDGKKYVTPPGGIILINPGAVHTGEAADANGFRMRCIYPTTSHMQAAAAELTGRHIQVPFFRTVRVDHPRTRENILSLHCALANGASALECDSRFTWTLAQLVKEYADEPLDEPRAGGEQEAVRRARRFIEEHFAERIGLTELAKHVALSPYYLLRVFRAQVGMPPYAYLESVRIRQAQRLIAAGRPLAEVAAEVGFSSQSHLTNRFKQIIGATPGQFARPLKS